MRFSYPLSRLIIPFYSSWGFFWNSRSQNEMQTKMNQEKENPFSLPLLQRGSQKPFVSSADFPQGTKHHSFALCLRQKWAHCLYTLHFSPYSPNVCKTLTCLVFVLCKHAYLGYEFKSKLCFAWSGTYFAKRMQTKTYKRWQFSNAISTNPPPGTDK